MKEIYTSKPNIPDIDSFLDSARDILESQYITNNGKYVQRLEHLLCEYLNVKHCICVSSGTVGLQLAARALNVTGHVIIPAFTFIATPHAFEWMGLKPLFCDINKNNYHIDVEMVEGFLRDTSYRPIGAIVGVHTFGESCDIVALEHLALRYNVRLIFDAAHAFGCSYSDTMIGNFGDCEVFSFHATKIFNTFEGGVITTNNYALANRLRMMCNFGIEHNGQRDYSIDCGINAKMSEIHAAMGVHNLETIDEVIKKHKENYDIYRALLRDAPNISVYEYNRFQKRNYRYIVLQINKGSTNLMRNSYRDELVKRLADNHIFARRYFYPPCNMHPNYVGQGDTDVAINMAVRTLCLPTGDIRLSDINKICDIIARYMEQNK